MYQATREFVSSQTRQRDWKVTRMDQRDRNQKTLLPLHTLLGTHNIIKEPSPKLTYDARLRRTI